jgi:hypothetical protein
MRLTASVSCVESRRSASGVDAGHSAVSATGVRVIRVSTPGFDGVVDDELPHPMAKATARPG